MMDFQINDRVKLIKSAKAINSPAVVIEAGSEGVVKEVRAKACRVRFDNLKGGSIVITADKLERVGG